MTETFKCPHCGAVYEIRYDKAVSEDNRLAHCEVCGKQMDARNGSDIRHYELVNLVALGRAEARLAAGDAAGLIRRPNKPAYTGRVCCGVELDPLYVDVIIRRYEAETQSSSPFNSF